MFVVYSVYMVWAGMNVIRLETVDSTNNYAKQNIDKYADKTVIYALRQTSGRGRLSRSWVDLGEGNLFMSIILKPSDVFNEIYPNLTQYLSVCLCRVLEQYGVKPEIKWPNDVQVNGKKIAGILSETVVQGSRFKGLVLGIGVNLNAKQDDTKAIEGRIVTALNIESGKRVDLSFFIEKLTGEFFDNYDEFLKKGFICIKDDYLKKNCFIGKKIAVQVFNRTEKGLASDVNDKGELVLLKDDNEETILSIGDISWI